MAARSRFWDDLNRDLQDPEHRREFERESERIAQIDALINELDEIRELQGKTKREVAMEAGMNPASVRRFFTQEQGNPTFATVFELAQALGYRLVLEPVDGEESVDESRAAFTSADC